MTEQPRKRGRPKGTGLDDSEMLSAIARLRSVDPDLKPTTAIRKLGITDPSVVRRLRDKLKSVPLRSQPSARRTITQSRPSPAAVKVRSTPRQASPSGQLSSAKSKNQDSGPLPSSPTKTLEGTRSASDSIGTDTEAQSAKPVTAGRASSNNDVTNKTHRQAAEASKKAPSTPRVEPTVNQSPEMTHSEQPTAETDIAKSMVGAIDPQLEAMRLAADAATAMSRLYLHCLTHANQISPMALALRGHAMSTQWFASAMATQQEALKAFVKKPE